MITNHLQEMLERQLEYERVREKKSLSGVIREGSCYYGGYIVYK